MNSIQPTRIVWSIVRWWMNSKHMTANTWPYPNIRIARLDRTIVISSYLQAPLDPRRTQLHPQNRWNIVNSKREPSNRRDSSSKPFAWSAAWTQWKSSIPGNWQQLRFLVRWEPESLGRSLRRLFRRCFVPTERHSLDWLESVAWCISAFDSEKHNFITFLMFGKLREEGRARLTAGKPRPSLAIEP